MTAHWCIGGSAKQARDRRFQAILPLRGKILNVERKDDASLYKNNEISNLILGLGLGLKGEDVTNLRYGKVSCCTSYTLCTSGSVYVVQNGPALEFLIFPALSLQAVTRLCCGL